MFRARMFASAMSLLVMLYASIVLPASATVHAGDAEFRVISTDELRSMMSEKKELTLIDTRTKGEYEEAHIKGAISVPEKSFEESAGILPADRNAALIMYCNGVKCGKSAKAAKKADAMGYKNILIYAEGFPVWEERGLPIVAGPEYGRKIETAKMKPLEIKALLEAKNQEIVLVDVRDETEFREGHIPSAMNIPVETFSSRSGVLPKEKKIIVYCNSGGRSYNAYRKLMKLAYPNIYQTTLADWKDAGMPVEK